MKEAGGQEGTEARSERKNSASPSFPPTCLWASVPPCLPTSSPPCLPACFNCIIPLSFIPEQSELGYLPGNTGLSDLKTLAITRLMIDNVAHLKAFWIMQGVHLSQVALDWGCDDLDGTVVW